MYPIFLSMTKRRQIALGSFALAAAGLSMSPEAASGQDTDVVTYRLDIDCNHRRALNEGTRSIYSIVGISDDGEEFSFVSDDADAQRLGDQDCATGVAPFAVSVSGPARIRHIRIELLDGQFMDDALFLDSLQLTVAGPDLNDSIGWGTAGGDGWCLSMDPDDIRGHWRDIVYDSQCYPCLEFSLIPVADESPIVDGDWSGTALPAYSDCPAVDSSS